MRPGGSRVAAVTYLRDLPLPAHLTPARAAGDNAVRSVFGRCCLAVILGAVA